MTPVASKNGAASGGASPFIFLTSSAGMATAATMWCFAFIAVRPRSSTPDGLPPYPARGDRAGWERWWAEYNRVLRDLAAGASGGVRPQQHDPNGGAK